MPPDNPLQPPKISRLSFRPDRYDTVLIDGQPLDIFFFGQSDNREFGQLVFPISSYYKEDRVLAMGRLKSLAGWMPVLICPGDMDLSCTVFSAWVEEQGGLIIWSRFAFGLDGEGDKVDVPPISFDKDDYLSFIKKAGDRCVAEHLLCAISSKPSRITSLTEELEKYGPAVAFLLLSRLVFYSARSRHRWKKRRVKIYALAAFTSWPSV